VLLVEQGLVRKNPKRTVRGGVAITAKGSKRLMDQRLSKREERILESTESGKSFLQSRTNSAQRPTTSPQLPH